MVLDVDVRDGKRGMESLAALQNAIGALPETFTVRTASGGLHLYFRTWLESSEFPVKLAGFPDIDVQRHGKYVLGPGSSINGGHYVVL